MNYFLLLLIILLCVVGYYEYSLETQKISDDETAISNLEAKVASLQSDNSKLTSDKAALTSSLATAKSKIGDASQAPNAATGTTPLGQPGFAPSNTSLQQLSQGVVLIKGDNAEGTGFLVKNADGPVVVTNLHVLANNPHIKIQTASGLTITITGMKGATDRDLAMLSIQDGPYTYLPLAKDVSNSVKAGDDSLTPGNSQGGDVVLNTAGKLLAVGPDRVEFNNPIYHGNSGGPVFHSASGTVVGVVTEAMKVDMTSDLDKTSFANRNSAISSSIRYFGLRIDNVPKWETYDPARYQNETAFLDQFNDQSRALDSFLNSSSNNDSANNASASAPNSKLYLNDKRIMAAHDTFRQQLSGTDTSGQIDALRQLSFALDGIADKDMEAVQDPNNFYTFDQQRAKYEATYRNALKKEIQEFGSDVNHIGSLPRSNN